MFLPEEYALFEPVIIAAIVVFFVDWIGNTITFSNRIVNAFVTAVLFGLIFGALVYFGYGSIEVSVSTTQSPNAPAIQTAPPTTGGQTN